MTAPARILVVEDEPQLRGLLRLYLERDGHRVTDAGDGPTALAAFDAEPCDLVILDLMLPGMQGETVLEALRDAGDVPVLITSAKAQRRRADRRSTGRGRRLPRQAVQPARAHRPRGRDPAPHPRLDRAKDRRRS